MASCIAQITGLRCSRTTFAKEVRLSKSSILVEIRFWVQVLRPNGGCSTEIRHGTWYILSLRLREAILLWSSPQYPTAVLRILTRIISTAGLINSGYQRTLITLYLVSEPAAWRVIGG